MIKVVTFFLIFIVVLALFGRLRLPRLLRRSRDRFCPRCGRALDGRRDCACGHRA
ncbi:hypothetical protein [Albidovulum sp.]